MPNRRSSLRPMLWPAATMPPQQGANFVDFRPSGVPSRHRVKPGLTPSRNVTVRGRFPRSGVNFVTFRRSPAETNGMCQACQLHQLPEPSTSSLRRGFGSQAGASARAVRRSSAGSEGGVQGGDFFCFREAELYETSGNLMNLPARSRTRARPSPPRRSRTSLLRPPLPNSASPRPSPRREEENAGGPQSLPVADRRRARPAPAGHRHRRARRLVGARRVRFRRGRRRCSKIRRSPSSTRSCSITGCPARRAPS